MTGSNGAGEGHGAAVRRVEDPPFLRGTRPYTDDLRNPEALYAVFVRSGFAHARVGQHRHVRGGRDARRRRRLHRRRPQPRGLPDRRRRRSRRPRRCAARCSRATPCASSASRSRSWSPRRAARPSTPPSSSTSTSSPLDALDRHDQGARRRRAASCSRTPRPATWPPSGPPGEDALADAEVRVGGRFINQRLAAVPMEPGAALAAPDPDTGGFILWTPSQGPHIQPGRRVRLDGNRAGAAAGHLDGDRRRLRRADRDLPRADRDRRAGARARPARALHRDALGDDARDAARPRAGAGRRDRRHPRRQGHRAEGARDPGLRRLPGRRRPDADAHRPDVVRRLRDPEGRLPLGRGRDEHDADRRLPRRRPAGGDRARRAGDGPVRGRARHGPGRGPAAQLHLRLPAPDGHRRQLRLRRLPGRAREVPEQRRLRPAARRPGGAPRARRRRPARDRPLQLRRVDRLRLGVRHVHGRGGRHGHRDRRHVLARPGPRDVLRAARRRDARRPAQGHQGGPVRHGEGRARRWARWARARCRSAAPRSRHATDEVLDKGRRLAAHLLEADAGDIEVVPGQGLGVAGSPATRDPVGRAGARPPPTRRGCRRASRAAWPPRTTSRRRTRRTRSARTSRSSRSTPRPGWRSSSVTSRSTTRAGSRTRCWSRARSTAASPRASRRRCSRRSRSTRTATTSPARWRATRSRARATCRRSRPSAPRRRRRATRWGRRASARRARSASTPAVWNAVVDALSPFGVRNIDMPATPQRVWQAISAAR